MYEDTSILTIKIQWKVMENYENKDVSFKT